MTKDQLWKIYTDKNPKFLGEGNVTLSKKGLKHLFDQTWDQAVTTTIKTKDIFEKLFPTK